MDDPSHNSPDPGDYGSPGEIAVGMDSALALILQELQNPTTRPNVQIVLRTTLAADAVTSVFSTHLKLNITQIVIPAPLASAGALVVGSDRVIEGIINGPNDTFFPCNIIVEPGADLQFVSATAAALFAIAPVTILLIGRIVN